MARQALVEKAKRNQKFKVRDHNRCKQCGRGRSYMRRFGVCRICFRELANNGQIPGVHKSSW